MKRLDCPPTAPPSHVLDADGRYLIRGYDRGPAFSSFLPGVAGPAGVPLWCMYVNRAQAIVSFGVHNKDQAIVEFLPATWAYQLVGVQGFRTFCKIDGQYYEPFALDPVGGTQGQRAMAIEPDALTLTETGAPGGLDFEVAYFSPVNQPLGALVRRVRVTNRARQARQLELLDGLPLILPAGFTDLGMKQLRHIHEAYAAVRLACDHVPFYAAKVVAHDEAEVTPVTHGHFYAAWLVTDSTLKPIEAFVDPHVIFGGGQDLITPRRFIATERLDRSAQLWENRLPCALAPIEARLAPGESIEWIALIGFAPSEDALARFLPQFTQAADFDAARAASRDLVTSVVEPTATFSSLPLLDAYTRQNWLDNVLRGGVPRVLPARNGPALLHLYARRHGDLERDYNYFILPPHPLSSGAGNYRDICQNRRCDVWFFPEIGDLEIRTFVNLLQPDGYNPLAIEGYRWELPPDGDPADLECPTTDAAAEAELKSLVQHPFQPGQLLAWADRHAVVMPDRQAWLERILAQCDCRLVAHGHEGGYWIDHWTYIVDLLEAFADIYPDRVPSMLTETADIGWFEDGAFVRPRADKFVRRRNGPLQLGAVADGPVPQPPLAPVTVFGKLCALLAIKAISLGPNGRGLEMEAGRPGWNDSLNGLPGLFGSSTCELAELARLASWLRAALPDPPDTALPIEVSDLIAAIVPDLSADFDWSHAAKLREQFRARIAHRTTADAGMVSGAQLKLLLAGVEARARRALSLSVDPQTGLIHTYYANKPTTTDDSKSMPTNFAAQPLPLFLEGQVHWLRIIDDPARARAVWHAVRRSALFDADLGMYKLNECLDACPPDIGRARTFTRGWFENESIWLHMSYKYLLELLRRGLYAEFFEDARTMLVPFLDPQRYGRSVLENSSFIASSANPDPATRGRGFIARLSGSSAEFIHIWRLLTVGPSPFTLDANELWFTLRPALPGAWFTPARRTITWRGQNTELPEGHFACTLLGSVLLVYHNPARRDTYGPNAVHPVRYQLDNSDPIEAPRLTGDRAQRLRNRDYTRLDVWLA